MAALEQLAPLAMKAEFTSVAERLVFTGVMSERVRGVVSRLVGETRWYAFGGNIETHLGSYDCVTDALVALDRALEPWSPRHGEQGVPLPPADGDVLVFDDCRACEKPQNECVCV
jgi:hypothetical protein